MNGGNLKSTTYRVLFNILFWTFLFTLVFAIRYTSGDNFGVHQLIRPIGPFRIFGNGLIMGVSVGLAYSIMEGYLKYYRNVFRFSLSRIIINRGVRQFFIASIVITVVAWINYQLDVRQGYIEPEQVPFTRYAQSATLLFLFIVALLGNTLLSIFRTLQMKIGENIFLDLLSGKYMNPIEEERAFLFMDLTSSTTIAEQMGHQKYSRFIQDCFKDLDVVLKENQADVYQYVGDEVVLTWRIKDAVDHAHCLNAFFDFTDRLTSRKKYYLGKYETLPVFKAGLHMGKVMTAEVGVIKRDIAYHSDVVNTAARIMSKCNKLGVSFITTQEIKNRIPDSSPFSFRDLGKFPLRGKNNEVELFEVIKNIF